MFYSPRIAPNTGNAIRMVAATGCELHLVEPLGFDLSEPKLRRAGLDYHDLASVIVHPNLAAAWDALAPARVHAFTAHATTSFAEVAYQPGDVLMFGPEPSSLDADTLADPHITSQLRIPMLVGRRSLICPTRPRSPSTRRGANTASSERCDYQLSQCTMSSTGSRLAGRKSVPLV